MPSAAFHSNYWQRDSAGPPPVTAGASARGGYIPWQTTVTIGSLFGVLQALYERLVKVRHGHD